MYVNRVGTFDVSCASYWWTRISAAGIRATHHLLGPEYMSYRLGFTAKRTKLASDTAEESGEPLYS